jgi:hypothetical protein
MEVIGHEAEGVDFHTGEHSGFREEILAASVVVVVAEHILAIDSTVVHVVPAARDIRSWSSSHTAIMSKGCHYRIRAT